MEKTRRLFGREVKVLLARDPLGLRAGFRLTRLKDREKRADSSVSLPSESLPKLNVGGGKGHPRLDGWSIVDVRPTADHRLDITSQPLPYGDGEVGVIFCSHTLEHIYPQRLEFVLKEFHRVLHPRGLVRILVPDIEKAIRAYIEKDRNFFELSDVGSYEAGLPIGGNLASWFYSQRISAKEVAGKGEGHVHCFDFEYLSNWLDRVGFSKVVRSGYRQSVLAEMQSDAFDRHPNESLFVEAFK